MTTYNTGAPVPSVDVRDLYDNAENLDNFSNGAALAYPDRLGVSRQSLAGIRAASSYQNLGAYGAGLVFTSYNQTFSSGGNFYAPSAGIALPYTTTGAGAGEIATFRNTGDALLRSDLLSTDAGKGYALVTGVMGTAATVAALKLLTGRYNADTVYLNSRTSGLNGGGVFQWDSSSTAVADDVKVVQSTGVVTGRWIRVMVGEITVTAFGADPSGVADSTTALTAARDFLSSHPEPKPRLVFPSGIYTYTTSPNWDIDNLDVVAQGNVYLRPTATGGNAIKIESGPLISDRVFNANWGATGGFIIQGVSGNSDEILCQGMIHGSVTAKVYGGASAAAGLRTKSCVLVDFAIVVTPGEANGTAWYSGAKPLVGIALEDKGIANTQTAYCSFNNCSVQATSYGGFLGPTLGNNFFGGDFEYCTLDGLTLTSSAVNNRFYGVDMEANTNTDVSCVGNYNEFYGCDTGFLFFIGPGAKGNHVHDGNHVSFNIASGALDNMLSGIKYNRGIAAAVITDSGTRTRFRDISDLGTGLVTDSPKSVSTLTVGATPFTYTNATGNAVRLSIIGGTVGSVTIYQGANNSLIPYPCGLITVLPGEQVQVGYSAAPVMKVFRG